MCHYAKCRDLFIDMLNVKMLIVVMLNVVTPALLSSKIADVGNTDVVCSAIACVNATFNSCLLKENKSY